jgi:hypothetical protein
LLLERKKRKRKSEKDLVKRKKLLPLQPESKRWEAKKEKRGRSGAKITK